MIPNYALLVANGIGVVGLTALMYWLLATGRLGTAREMTEKNREIADLKQALKERDAQLNRVLDEYLPAANSVMKALHSAAGEMDDP